MRGSAAAGFRNNSGLGGPGAKACKARRQHRTRLHAGQIAGAAPGGLRLSRSMRSISGCCDPGQLQPKGQRRDH